MPIVKHNTLIETSYKLNSREQFFVLYLISQISQGDKAFTDYKMHYSEIEKIINFDGKRRIANKSEVFQLMDKLNSEPIIYERGSVIGKSVWLQHMEHDTDTDIFTFSLSEKLREYLLQLKEHFTRYNISNIVYLNANAVRLYEVLKRFQFKGECELGVDKLKFYLGIEDRYAKFYEFKRWVLVPSQREIEKYTDIRFEFIPAKKDKKKILSLRFSIFENVPTHNHDRIKVLGKLDKKSAASVDPNAGIDPETESLTATQKLAFQFLAEKGVNKKFIRQQILAHPKVQYLPLRSYEDVYAKMLWKFFSDKSTVATESRAGAFVAWWKNGRLTEDGLHAHMIERVIERKKRMTKDERQKREALMETATTSADQLMEVLGQQMRQFDLNHFKKENPEQYNDIFYRVRSEYEAAFDQVKVDFKAEKYQKAILDKVAHECKKWALTHQRSA